MITSSTSFESSCGTLPRTSLMAWAVKSSGRVRLNEPRNDLASGVRELATMTASLITVSFLDGRDGHDLDQVLGRRQPRLHGRPRRGVGGIDPGVPGGVHVAVHPHVGHVHGGGERSEERRVGKSVDLGGRRIIKKKKKRSKVCC